MLQYGKFYNYYCFAINNIFNNKLFSGFCLIASAFTFLFLNIIIQISIQIISDAPPFVNGSRVINIYEYNDINGKYIGGIAASEINTFKEFLPDHINFSIQNTESVNVRANHKTTISNVSFINSAYFEINNFHFVEGRPFTKEEVWQKEKLAVITEKFRNSYLKTNKSIGQKIEFQNNTYKVIGVVEDYSFFSTPGEITQIWVPYKFNKFIPSGETFYLINILFNPEISSEEMKEEMAGALNTYFKNKGQQLNISPLDIATFQEQKINKYGDSSLFWGIGTVIFLLFIIPTVNILTLSEASIKNRITEISLRRAVGATKTSVFLLIFLENFILVLSGAILGYLMTIPCVRLIEEWFFETESLTSTILSYIDYFKSLILIIPYTFIFALLSGGIPSYLIARRNISEMLKGKNEYD